MSIAISSHTSSEKIGSEFVVIVAFVARINIAADRHVKGFKTSEENGIS